MDREKNLPNLEYYESVLDSRQVEKYRFLFSGALTKTLY